VFGFLTPGQGSKDSLRGRTADANLWVNVVGASDDDTVSGNKVVLRPLIGLMNGLQSKEIERFVVEEIEKHRRLRGDAVRLEVVLESQVPGESKVDVNRAYVSAMIAVHAQQTVVSTLLDILGYIPEMPKSKSH
jgi:TraR antiactivator